MNSAPCISLLKTLLSVNVMQHGFHSVAFVYVRKPHQGLRIDQVYLQHFNVGGKEL